MPTIPNVGPAGFSVPALPGRSRYGRAIVGMYSDLADCWPCDDAATATSLRNIVSGRSALDTFYSNTVFPGRASLLANDPRGKSIQLMAGAVYHAAAYTMPTTGTLEMLCSGVGGLTGGDSAICGNWNGSGITWLQISLVTASTRFYRNADFTTYSFVPADMLSTQHWALTWDGTTQRFYVNGIQRATQAVGNPSAGGYFGLGVYSNAIHPTNGRFQWIAIYNRPLAASEVAAHAALVTQPG